MKKTLRDSHGFSLVELIIVIAIMAVLIGLLAPQYLKYVEKARVQKILSNTQSVANAITVLLTSVQTMDDASSDAFNDWLANAEAGGSIPPVDLSDEDDVIATLIRNEISGEINGTVTFNRTADDYLSFTYTMADGRYEVDYRADLRAGDTLVKSDGFYNVYLIN